MFIAISCAITPSRAKETELAGEKRRRQSPKLPANLLINKQSAQLDGFISKKYTETNYTNSIVLLEYKHMYMIRPLIIYLFN